MVAVQTISPMATTSLRSLVTKWGPRSKDDSVHDKRRDDGLHVQGDGSLHTQQLKVTFAVATGIFIALCRPENFDKLQETTDLFMKLNPSWNGNSITVNAISAIAKASAGAAVGISTKQFDQAKKSSKKRSDRGEALYKHITQIAAQGNSGNGDRNDALTSPLNLSVINQMNEALQDSTLNVPYTQVGDALPADAFVTTAGMPDAVKRILNESMRQRYGT